MSKVKHMSHRDGETNRWFCTCGDAQHVFEVTTDTDEDWLGPDIQISVYITTGTFSWNPFNWRHNLSVLARRIKNIWLVVFGGEVCWTDVVISEHDRESIANAIMPDSESLVD